MDPLRGDLYRLAESAERVDPDVPFVTHDLTELNRVLALVSSLYGKRIANAMILVWGNGSRSSFEHAARLLNAAGFDAQAALLLSHYPRGGK